MKNNKVEIRIKGIEVIYHNMINKMTLKLKTKRFQRKKENFVCQNCGFNVAGNGYTDHCPKCLYSKHVDINPGDRQADCHGLMKPIGIEIKSDKTRIMYKCLKCGYKHTVTIAKDDDFNRILEVVSQAEI